MPTMRLRTKTLAMQPVGTTEPFTFSAGRIDGVGEDVEVSGSLTRLERGYLVSVGVRARAQAPCDRCLAPTLLDLEGAVEETVGDPDEPSDVPFDGETIDLLPLVNEAGILAWPTKVLCRAECRGLCRRCGKDLNTGPCGCTEEESDPRFDVLKNFHLEDD